MRTWSVLVVVVLGLAALAVPAPAAAHSALVATDPAADTVVTTRIDHVSLTFSEAPLAGLDAGLRIEVRDAGGTDVGTGAVEVDGTVMRRGVTLGTGPYTVVWRYVSPDGHPVTGSFAFTADPGPTTSATTGAGTTDADATDGTEPTATASAPAATTSGSASAGSEHHGAHGEGALLWVAVAALLAAVVVAVVSLVRRRRQGAHPSGTIGATDHPEA